MSHFGRSGPPDIRDTFSLLVLNISFRTTADDLYPLFERYGKVVDVFIPRDRRTGDSRGFAFVRYKYAEEAQKAIDRLDGRNVDGRNIMVQFANSLFMLPTANLIYFNSGSPVRHSASPPKSPTRPRSPTDRSPEKQTNGNASPLSRSVSPSPKREGSRSPGSDNKVRLKFNF
ncbi:hypothetical protein PR202_ga21328 [Eleusine coracana subsp. coracana]|uniref:RRM domain-containing protein n=1 Tax=Eleusine coracana subsp. coracana TaxID=191504 RepID=A0AAV5CZD9_ELECO|nr:hypothetical protein PR202_ga21328 [Eleusine coracana subsp. coracana]